MSNTKNQGNLQELVEQADKVFADFSRRTESKPIYERALRLAMKKKRILEAEYIQGKIDLLNKKYEDAAKHFDEVTKLDFLHFKAWRYEGFALDELGRHEEAIICYDKALEIRPDDESSWYNKGNALEDLGRYEEAIICYDRALEIKPDHELAWNNKGAALRHLGRYEEAIICYDRALEIKPDYMSSWYNKGNALVYLGRYEESIICYDRALEIKPDDELTWNNKGTALAHLGRHEEALVCYDRALEIKPDDELTWNNKGTALGKLGKHEEALVCYDRALEIKPDDEIPRTNKNLTLLRLGRIKEAETERKIVYSDRKKEISESELSLEEKKAELLEVDAWNEVLNELKDKTTEILEAKRCYEDTLASSLKVRNEPLGQNLFSVLRRWNSYTPTLHTDTEENLGGGYFLYWKGKGIVIDPGFNFIDNFLNNGFLIYDIDAVVITHAHVDHCSDFEAILTLLHEYNEKRENKKRIDLFMNMGAMKKFFGWIPLEDSDTIRRIYSLEEGISHDLEGFSLRLNVKKALHDEILSKTYSVGLIFELYGENGYTRDNPFRIGYTSDTRHDEDVETQYAGVDIIVPHLGSIDESDFKFKEEKKRGDHLYLKGVVSTIIKSNAKLAIVSEFGEELGEHRMTIIGALDRVFQNNDMARCLTGDIGLTVSIPDLKVRCRYCEGFVDLSEITEAIDPTNRKKKRIIYYCKNCINTHEFQVRNSSS
jgi:tetratricopeptide (TPR) repeat protein/ribonuclease BN (tRNA processing enzyme)